jgi:hypothetical protein
MDKWLVIFHKFITKNSMHTQCLKYRPICRLISRLIVNHWVNDTITTYQSNLSPWPIYQSNSRYFDQNIPNVATYGDFVDDSSIREKLMINDFLNIQHTVSISFDSTNYILLLCRSSQKSSSGCTCYIS